MNLWDDCDKISTLAVVSLKFPKTDILSNSGKYRTNQFTILLHLAGGLLISIGFVITAAAQ